MGFLLALFLLCSPFSLIIIWYGGKKEIGSRKTFWITFFFSPIIGLIAVLLSETKEIRNFDYYGELLKLTELKEKNVISEKEFDIEKRKVDSSRYEKENPVADKAGVYYYLIFLGVLTLILVGMFLLVAAGGGDAVAPFVYTLF